MNQLAYTNPPPAAAAFPFAGSPWPPNANQAFPNTPTAHPHPSPGRHVQPPAHDGVSLAAGQARPMHAMYQPYEGPASFENQPNAFGNPNLTGLHSASPPSQRLSPNAAGQQQYLSQPNSSTPPTQVPMAAPPLSQSPANAQPTPLSYQQPKPAVATPSNPQSPTGATTTTTTTTTTSSRDQQRIALLLEINQEILTEIHRLQADDQGGAINTQVALQLKQAGQADKMASEDYIQLLRRLQGNFAYLMPRTGQAVNTDARIIPGPAFMQHPPQMPQLADKYARLRDLFPEWPGNDAKLMAMSAAGAGPGAGAGAGSPPRNMHMQQQARAQPQSHPNSHQQQYQQNTANGAIS